ncbi:MAG: Verru_Chthon cassette protein D [Phycisphaerae bacterium]|jgi:uncharacterized protein (TIGR02596 family)
MKPRSAFSLMELLVVMAIIGLLATFLAPAVTPILRGSRLTQAGDQALAVLSLARQTALTTSHAVEVRFYQYGDPEVPGESAASPTTGKYRAIQAFEYKDDGTATPVGKMATLPPSIIMDQGATLSTIIGSAKSSPAVPTSTTGGALNVSIPRAGKQYNSVSFRFLADGSTNLSTTGTLWFLTLHNLIDGDNMTSPPPNYTTIKIDPMNGSLKTYRP